MKKSPRSREERYFGRQRLYQNWDQSTEHLAIMLVGKALEFKQLGEWNNAAETLVTASEFRTSGSRKSIDLINAGIYFMKAKRDDKAYECFEAAEKMDPNAAVPRERYDAASVQSNAPKRFRPGSRITHFAPVLSW